VSDSLGAGGYFVTRAANVWKTLLTGPVPDGQDHVVRPLDGDGRNPPGDHTDRGHLHLATFSAASAGGVMATGDGSAVVRPPGS